MKIKLNILLSVLLIANLNASQEKKDNPKLKEELGKALGPSLLSDIQDIIWSYIAPFKAYTTLNEGHGLAINSVAFSPNSKYLASGSSNNEVRVWDVLNGKELQNFKDFESPVNVVTYSHDGKYLAVGSDDESIKIIDTRAYDHIRDFPFGPTYSLAFSPDDKQLAAGGFGKASILDINDGQILKELGSTKISRNLVNYLAYFYKKVKFQFKPESNLNLIIGSKSDIGIWNFNWFGSKWHSESEVFKDLLRNDYLGLLGASYKDMVVSNNKIVLAKRNMATILNLDSGDLEHSLKNDKEYILYTKLAYSPDGGLLALADSMNNITLLNTFDYETFQTLKSHGVVKSLAFSPDNKFLAAGQEGGTIEIWQLI